MKNLIPIFIHEQYKNKKYTGNFDAFTMFVDVSGFTPMTEALMKGGDEGAEILSNILNRIFEPMVNAVYKRGGFITGFAGDAFTAIFPIKQTDLSIHVLDCGQRIQNFIQKNGLQKTKFGIFELKVKVGISQGNVDWGIVGKAEKAHFFRGEAIDGCAESEHQASKGEIIFDEEVIVNPEFIKFEIVAKGYFRLRKITRSAIPLLPKLPRRPRLTKKVAAQFLPDELLNLDTMGEFRNVVALFIAYDGISTTEELDDWIFLLLENIKKFSGYLNKLSFGDKGSFVLCGFGAPVAFENNVERALEFILSVKTNVENFQNLAHLKFRVGTTYGLTYAGLTGGEKRCEYTYLGDVVNLASRFMTTANWNEVWVSEEIYHYSNEFYQFEFAGKHTFKGKSDQISVYKLQSKQSTLMKRFKGKFIGRTEELEFAERSFSYLGEGKFGGIVYVYGQGGVGKSRLVAEIQKRKSAFRWLYLPCDGILKKSFNPFVYLFAQFFEQSPKNRLSQNQTNFERIYDRLVQQIAPLEEMESVRSELIRLKPVIVAFLNIDNKKNFYYQLDAKLRYENMLDAFKILIKTLSLQHPVVLNIDDIQWIDPDSVNALKVICRNIEDFPVLLIATSRYYDDGSKPLLPLDIHAQEIDLNTFSSKGVREVVESLLNGNPSAELIKLIQDKTQGNPFFIQQILLYFEREGIISFENNAWKIVKKNNSIPPTIQDLLVARIDKLPQKLKDIVQTASVLGQDFEITILAEASGQENFDFFLKEGEKENVWDSLSELRYVFSHAMMKDAVYQMQLKARLRKLHLKVAQVLEKTFTDEKSHFSDLAFHYDKAESTGKAIDYLGKAGDYAKENYQNQRAIGFYDRLLLNITDPEDQLGLKIDTMSKKGEILQLIGKWDECRNAREEALGFAEKIMDKNRIASLNRALGVLFLMKGAYEQAMVYLKKSLKISRELGDKQGISTTVGNMGIVYNRKGNSDAAMECYENHLKISQELGDKEGISKAVCNMGVFYRVKGDYEKEMVCYKKYLKISQELDNKENISRAVGNIGAVYYNKGDYEAAMAYYEKCLKINQELGNKRGIVSVVSNMGIVYKNKGDYEAAMECYEKSLRISQELGDKQSVARVVGNMGGIHCSRGDYEAAMACYEKSLKISQKLGNKRNISIAIGNMGIVHAHKGEYEEAMVCYEKQLKIDEKLGDKLGIFYAVGNMGNIYKDRGDYEAAIDCYDRAIAIGRELGAISALCECLINKAEVFYLAKRCDEAKICNVEGLKIAEEIGIKEQISKGKSLLKKYYV
ncbi:MAG: hypothetical protein B6244_01105 [Candidatus Cloacimonetes bacterium 4572_55]|nr:MAG: hypothetical protein B6244_01105 [Candidatus Cloacimonetes bacterium 4572_55]